jgi:hypothetical protein
VFTIAAGAKPEDVFPADPDAATLELPLELFFAAVAALVTALPQSPADMYLLPSLSVLLLDVMASVYARPAEFTLPLLVVPPARAALAAALAVAIPAVSFLVCAL